MPLAASSDPQSGARLNRVLGMPALVLFGLAYMVPLTVFTTYGVVTDMTAGHLPTAYVVTLAAMVFTAYSYGRMVRAHRTRAPPTPTRRSPSAVTWGS